MAVNSIELATIFQEELDKQLVEESVTGWMEANAGTVIYNGGAEVKIGKLTMDGLGDYDRSKGYPDGAVSLVYQTMTMTQDRGRGFTLDKMDVNESNFQATASNVMGAFQREYVTPEVDLYRLNKIATLAGDNNRSLTPTDKTVFGELTKDIAAVQDKIGTGTQLVVHIAMPIHAMLSRSAEYNRSVMITDFERGAIKTKVKSIDGVTLLPTQSKLMQTVITKQDGRTTGQEKGGYKVEATSKGINWLIIPVRAPIAVCKTDEIRIFDPHTYQELNAWRVDYRKYHDLWVTDNKKPGLFANIGE